MKDIFRPANLIQAAQGGFFLNAAIWPSWGS